MQTLKDLNDRSIRLTAERLAHILEHPEMVGQELRIAETLVAPDSIIASHHDATVLLYHKLYATTPITRKYMVVMVKVLDADAFVITAFFTDKEKKGTHIWTR